MVFEVTGMRNLREIWQPPNQINSDQVVWALANFFLHLFVWGLITILLANFPLFLLVNWGLELWEVFWLLPIASLAIGVFLAITPLWIALHPDQPEPSNHPRETAAGSVWAYLGVTAVIVLLMLAVFGFLASDL